MSQQSDSVQTSDADRLQRLRRAFDDLSLDGFVVPLADEYQGEWVPPSARRLEWLTGFTGSAGTAVVLADRAALFVDGRYTLQARNEVDTGLFDVRPLTNAQFEAWIGTRMPVGGRLGYDPRLHTVEGAESLRSACLQAEAAAVAVAANPLDAAWSDRPAPPAEPMAPFDEAQAGRSAQEKRRQVGKSLAEAKTDAALITKPESIAWLLNIRGGDLPYMPVALAYAIAFADGQVTLFVDPAKVTEDVATHLGNGVSTAPPEALAETLDALGRAAKRVRIDPQTAPEWPYDRLHQAGATVLRGPDPCALPKATKNPVELAGIRDAHRRDGAALCRFLAWFDGAAPEGDLSETVAAAKLEWFRRQNPEYRGPSFPTISGSGPNGAIVHYRATERSNRTLGADELFLVDSGGQYPDGTTDVTRTVVVGTPTAEMRDRFTRVLKGHIALATAVFPEDTVGGQLDVLARQFLWRAGLDYDHGTGHGVGHFLGVHEGPQRISKAPNATRLKPGMILSNEPGFYKEGAYGIRIENLVAVTPIDPPESRDPDGAQGALGFETLTLCPIDRRLIDPDMLTAAETAWLDGYHRRVYDELFPQLDDATSDWLDAATRPVR